jgi:phosphoribosyl 1,2-cyclic phosphate phosphodiesterase
VETDSTQLLIDCGPDFRQQMLPRPFRRLDGILVTHSHYDHVGGMDDVRPYCQFGEINVYADPLAKQSLLQMMPYCFAEHRYPGVPAIGLHEIQPHVPFTIGDITILPFRVMHGQLPILAYRFTTQPEGAYSQPEGTRSPRTLVYITDMKTIEDEELPYACHADVLVVNALRQQRPHHSHQLLAEAIDFAQKTGARRTLLTHACHDIGLHRHLMDTLPQGVEMGYDGQVVSV